MPLTHRLLTIFCCQWIDKAEAFVFGRSLFYLSNKCWAHSLPPWFLLEPIVSEKSFEGIHCEVRTCLECDLLIISVITNVSNGTNVENILFIAYMSNATAKILNSRVKNAFFLDFKILLLERFERYFFSMKEKSMFWQYSFERASSYLQLVSYRSIFS